MTPRGRIALCLSGPGLPAILDGLGHLEPFASAAPDRLRIDRRPEEPGAGWLVALRDGPRSLGAAFWGARGEYYLPHTPGSIVVAAFDASLSVEAFAQILAPLP